MLSLLTSPLLDSSYVSLLEPFFFVIFHILTAIASVRINHITSISWTPIMH